MMNTDRVSLQAIGLLFLCLGSINCYAAMYKWVDAEGNTHYSQHPPTDGAAAETIAPPPEVDSDKAVTELKEQQEMLDKQDEEKSNQVDESRKTGEEQAKKAKRCEQSREKLAKVERPRVNLTGADGNRIRLSEEERQAEIEKANASIAENCE